MLNLGLQSLRRLLEYNFFILQTRLVLPHRALVVGLCLHGNQMVFVVSSEQFQADLAAVVVVVVVPCFSRCSVFDGDG